MAKSNWAGYDSTAIANVDDNKKKKGVNFSIDNPKLTSGSPLKGMDQNVIKTEDNKKSKVPSASKGREVKITVGSKP